MLLLLEEFISVKDTSLPSPHPQILQLKGKNYISILKFDKKCYTLNQSVCQLSVFKSLIFKETSFLLLEKYEWFALK